MVLPNGSSHRRLVAGTAALGIAATVILVLGPTATVSVSAADDSGLVRAAIDFRETFGLRADGDYVRRSLIDPAFDSATWSVPLSKAEIEDVDGRVRIHRATLPALEWAEDFDDYAGMYLDQHRDGIPVFLTSGSMADYRAGLADRLPDGLDYEVEKVDSSLKQLERTKDQLSDARIELLEDGITLVSATVDVPGNRVLAGVLDDTDKAERAIHQVDPDIRVSAAEIPVADPCSITSCGPGMHGGLKIYEANTSPVKYCTSGYLVRRIDGSHHELMLETAGHCIVESPGDTDGWKHPSGTSIGNEIEANGWHGDDQAGGNDSLADVGYIDLNSDSEPSYPQKFLSKPSDGILVHFTDSTPAGSQAVGTPVCRIGAGSATDPQAPAEYTARKCGTIKEYDTDTLSNGNQQHLSCDGDCKYIRHMKSVSFDSWPGDSGGTVFEQNSDPSDPTSLFGSHVDSYTGTDITNRGWYSTATWAYQEMYQNHGGMAIQSCTDANGGCDY